MNVVDFIVVDFWEDDLFMDIYVVVIMIVERFSGQVMEVMDMRYSNSDQVFKEFLYVFVMQSYFIVDWIVLMDFEVCNRFVCFGDQWFLIGDCCQVCCCVIQQFFVSDCFINIYVQGDFFDLRDLYDRIVVKFSYEFFNYFVFVVIMQFCYCIILNYLIVLLLDLKKWIFLLFLNLKFIWLVLLVVVLKIAMLEI